MALGLGRVIVVSLLLLGCRTDLPVPEGAGGQGASSTGGDPSSGGAPSSGAPMDGGSSASSLGGRDGGNASVGGGGSGGEPNPPPIVECGGHIYACADGVDNDADGLIDADDSECLGACDNSEDSFYPGFPDWNMIACRFDCIFDPNGGPGDDDCHWSHRCDPFEIDPDYFPEPDHGDNCAYEGSDYEIKLGLTCAQAGAAQSQQCMDTCLPIVPNGCDCFGCCDIPGGTGNFVWIGSTGASGDSLCTIDDATNPDICHPCTPVPSCMNTCEPCERCIGRPLPDPSCGDPGLQCAAGVQTCGASGEASCPADQYCVTGCCRPTPP